MTRIPPLAQRALRADIQDAAERKSIVELRAFSREARLSDMPAEADRADELIELISAWEAKNNRAELLKIKAATEPTPPSQADLVASFNRMVFANGPPFDRDETPDLQRRRAEEANRQLAAKNEQAEERRQAHVAETATKPERPWWR